MAECPLDTHAETNIIAGIYPELSWRWVVPENCASIVIGLQAPYRIREVDAAFEKRSLFRAADLHGSSLRLISGPKTEFGKLNSAIARIALGELSVQLPHPIVLYRRDGEELPCILRALAVPGRAECIIAMQPCHYTALQQQETVIAMGRNGVAYTPAAALHARATAKFTPPSPAPPKPPETAGMAPSHQARPMGDSPNCQPATGAPRGVPPREAAPTTTAPAHSWSAARRPENDVGAAGRPQSATGSARVPGTGARPGAGSRRRAGGRAVGGVPAFLHHFPDAGRPPG